jgi:hypothetical protein
MHGTVPRLDWKRWTLLLIASFAFLWWAGLNRPVQSAFENLANRPEVQTAFTDADHGRMDAILMLVSVAALAPLTAFLALLTLVFALILFALALEPFLGVLRAPAWLTVPVVLGGAATTAYLLRDVWLPHAVYVAGLVARAWVVYTSTGVAVPH